MNIETVNELIQSLESAGELSIKETKVMALAKAYLDVAAENVQARERHSFIRALAISILEHSGGRHDWRGAMEDASDLVKTVDEIYSNTPATDRIVAGIKADAITASLDACSDYLETDCVMDRLDISYEHAEKRTSGAIEFHDVMVNFANQMREGAK